MKENTIFLLGKASKKSWAESAAATLNEKARIKDNDILQSYIFYEDVEIFAKN